MSPDASDDALLARVLAVRAATTALCEPLALEDYGVQTMPDVSPTKWHLGHTTWFFEAFVLAPFVPSWREYHPRYGYLFNSYYESVGSRVPRPERGLLSRPTVAEVFAYRARVDEALAELAGRTLPAAAKVALELGLHHEQQHQELLLTDIKHVLGTQPLRPAYRPPSRREDASAARGFAVEGFAPDGFAPDVVPSSARTFVPFDGGLRHIGATADGFSFDNERPRHPVYVPAFGLGRALVTVGEYLAFLEDGGYARPELWLSDGWATVRERGWHAPLYWHKPEPSASWELYTLGGVRPLRLDEPVTHVSYYEADAFARWAGARLPTEAEWEIASQGVPLGGNFVESGALHPRAPAGAVKGLAQLFGDGWEWTQSAYAPYPGFEPLGGAFAEYNGKFMCSQLVLRGGSCATPERHLRRTYRNFFPPNARWQFTALRLARSNP